MRIKTESQLERVKQPKLKTDDREMRIEYSDEKRRYVYKDFCRIMTQIISYARRKQNPQEKLELASFIGYTIPELIDWW